MLLKTELKKYDCSDSPGEFENRLTDIIEQQFSGRSIDGLLCEPVKAIAFCRIVREAVQCKRLPDAVPLKTLLKIRKSGKGSTGLNGNTKKKGLDAALTELHCDLSPDQFRDLLINALVDMYKDQTVDTLLCNPRQALDLCEFVRRKAMCPRMPNQFILSRLMNVRKAQTQ